MRKNALYNVAYRLFSVLLPLVTAPYLSRVAGQAGVGLYEYAWSISYVFCLVGMLGLESYGVRAIAAARGSREELDRTFSEIWRMQLAVAGVTLLAYLGYVAFVAGEEQVIALHLTMMSVSCLVNVDWCLMGLDQFKPIALRNTLVKLSGMAAVFLLVRGPEDLWLYALVWSLATLLGCLSCWTALRGRVRVVRVSWRGAWKHFSPCAWLFVSVLAVSVYRQMDKVMVGAISGMAQNGLYVNAEKIIYCLSGFISALGTVLLPQATRLLCEGRMEALRLRIEQTMELMMCMTCAMAFGVAAVAEQFAPLFFGEAFTASGPLMAPLAFTLVMIGFANVIRTQWILPQERTRLLIASVVSGAAVNLCLNLLLIPRLGAMGAVVGTLAAEGTVPLVQWLRLRRELSYGPYMKSLAVYSLMGMVMLLAVRAIGMEGWPGLAARTLAGAAVYGALCLIWWKHSGGGLLKILLRRKA